MFGARQAHAGGLDAPGLTAPACPQLWCTIDLQQPRWPPPASPPGPTLHPASPACRMTSRCASWRRCRSLTGGGVPVKRRGCCCRPPLPPLTPAIHPTAGTPPAAWSASTGTPSCTARSCCAAWTSSYLRIAATRCAACGRWRHGCSSTLALASRRHCSLMASCRFIAQRTQQRQTRSLAAC